MMFRGMETSENAEDKIKHIYMLLLEDNTICTTMTVV